jgi:hypothetical protein
VDLPETTGTVERPKTPVGTYLWGHSAIVPTEEVPGLLDEFIRPAVRAQLDEEERLRELEESLEDSKGDEGVAEPDSEGELTAGPEAEEEKLSPDEIEEQRFHWANESFGDALPKGARGVIIVYAHEDYDLAKLTRFVEQGAARIAAAAKLKGSRITVVYGGYRAQIEIEYYIVPKGGRDPQPAPDETPVGALTEPTEPLPLK